MNIRIQKRTVSYRFAQFLRKKKVFWKGREIFCYDFRIKGCYEVF